MASTFPTTLDAWGTVTDTVDDVDALHVNDLRDAIEKIQAKVGIDSSAVTTTLDYKVNKFFSSGRKLWIYENAAPTGWALVSVTDRVVAVKGGSQAYNVLGSNEAGSWTLSGINTEASHTHTRGAHSHSSTAFSPSRVNISDDAGSGLRMHLKTSSHNHSVTGSSGSTGVGVAHTHTHAGTDRPYAAVGIIIQKT